MLAGLTATLLLFWNTPYLMPLKVFVVYLHEISHSIGAVLTGGEVISIDIHWDESGYTETRGGNFLAIASSGYIGSILIGSIMLHSGVSGRGGRIVSAPLGIILIVFTLFVPQRLALSVFIVGIFWGLLILLSGLWYYKANRVTLFFMGGLTSLYSLYDLGDFFRGQIEYTDAGILAGYYTSEPQTMQILAYAIGIFISAVSVWLLYRVLIHALHTVHPDTAAQNETNPGGMDPQEELLLKMQLVEKLSPEMLQVLGRLQENHRDLPEKTATETQILK